MSTLLVAKRKEYEAKAEELTALLAKDKLDKDDQGKLEKLTSEVTTLRSEADTLAKAEALNATIKAETGASITLEQGEKQVAQVTKSGAEFSSDAGGITDRQFRSISDPAYNEAFQALLHSKNGEAGLSNIHRKALSEGIDSDGGFLVPTQVIAGLIHRKFGMARVNGLVSKMSVGSKSVTFTQDQYSDSANIIYPNGMRTTLTGEVPASATVHEAADQTFGQVNIPINKWMISKTISNDLVEDANVDLVGYIGEYFSGVVQQLMDYQILLGAGDALGCRGIITNKGGANGVSVYETITNDTLAADDIIKLPFQIAEQYLENCHWVMNRMGTGAAIALMKDAENRYLFRRGGAVAGLDERVPDVLNGDPIAYSEHMPNGADATCPILYGDLRGYHLLIRSGFSVQVSNGGEDMKKDQTVVVGRLRMGGDCTEPWRMKLLEIN